ncbi:hypothetical protein Lal_00028671 [Lupinus albus]|nr:hypothetical protein Lal_00028671 [Lupinus albus]
MIAEWIKGNQSNFESLIWLDPCVLQEKGDEQSSPLRRKEATIFCALSGAVDMAEKPSKILCGYEGNDFSFSQLITLMSFLRRCFPDFSLIDYRT